MTLTSFSSGNISPQPDTPVASKTIRLVHGRDLPTAAGVGRPSTCGGRGAKDLSGAGRLTTLAGRLAGILLDRELEQDDNHNVGDGLDELDWVVWNIEVWDPGHLTPPDACTDVLTTRHRGVLGKSRAGAGLLRATPRSKG
jgi:hypothetical protein